MICIVVWFTRQGIVELYTGDAAVARLALELFPILVAFHWFDALQCVATQTLRGYQQTLIPMLIYAFALWGIGVGVGYALAFGTWPTIWAEPLGARGFWYAQAASLVVCTVALWYEFRRVAFTRVSSLRRR